MMFKTHLALGILLGILSVKLFEIEHEVIFFILVVFASILPDIDISKSKLGSKVKPLSWFINLLFGHRGIFHGIFMPLILYFLFLLFNQTELGTGVFIGYVSHLFLDGFSKGGVRLLHPISKLKMHGFIKSGSSLDYGLMFLFLILIVFILF